LSNKWNAREFARKHGCSVPALYWYGRRPAHLSLEKLPSNYVIKPALGQSCRQVYVMSADIDLMHRRRLAAPELRAHLIDTYGRVSLVPILVEEFVGAQELGKLAIDYKCHVFGDVVAAIEVVVRESAQHARYMFYTADWEPFTRPLVTAKYEPGCYQPPPHCLDEMLRHARALGIAYGTFVRADFYVDARGAIFGELSTTPNNGNGFTDYADRYFEELWREKFPTQT
jgi:hypothetical protein